MIQVVGVKMYDVAELSQMMGVGRDSVYNYLKNGLSSRKIGHKYYVSEENLKQYLLNRK